MYSYITSELPDTVFENFKQLDCERVSIFGHSMGGHGALTLVSALYPPSSLFLVLDKWWSGMERWWAWIDKDAVLEESGEI